MRLNRRQPDLFEKPPRLRQIPNERRGAMVESVRALLAVALSQKVSAFMARLLPGRSRIEADHLAREAIVYVR